MNPSTALTEPRATRHEKHHASPLGPLGPAPPASSSAVHNVMLANRGKGTRVELRLVRALKKTGVGDFETSFRIGRTSVDVAFPKQRVAIFVHGCFWHRCPVCRLPLPKSNRDFWRRKFALNKARDKRVRLALEASGWKTIVLWEHQIDADVDDCAERIRSLV